jgi:PAS domain S-box-containing protein
MNIGTKLALFFLATVLVPSVASIVILLIVGKGVWWGLLTLLISIPCALALSFMASRSLARPLTNLGDVLERMVSGDFDAPVPEETFGATTEVQNLISHVGTLTATLAAFRTETQDHVASLEDNLGRTTTQLREMQTEAGRLDAVMVGRELRMIELKNELRDAYVRLGDPRANKATNESFEDNVNTDPESSRTATLNILEDLNEERKILATERAKDEAIFRSIGDGLAVADARGAIVFFNENAKELLGLTSVDMHANVWEQLKGVMDPVSNKPLSPDEIPLMQAVKGHAVEKQRFFVKNDEIPEGRYISMTATPIMVAGFPMGGVAIFRDMTKEQEVDRAKTEFVSLASHQLRTPLSSINWYTEMLLAGDAGEINDEQKKFLTEVYKGNQRMVELINALLNVSRLELGTFAVDPEDTDVIALAQSVLDEQMPQIHERNIQLSTHLAPGTPHLLADPKLLRMVLQNLVSNAVKYTLPGGSLSVRVEPDADNIAITVADTGLGIPKEEQGRIFSKLFRATNARTSDTDGTGLGLYIVKSVVENAGGTIHFESTEGKGTTFFIKLPKTGMHKKEGAKSLS